MKLFYRLGIYYKFPILHSLNIFINNMQYFCIVKNIILFSTHNLGDFTVLPKGTDFMLRLIKIDCYEFLSTKIYKRSKKTGETFREMFIFSRKI